MGWYLATVTALVSPVIIVRTKSPVTWLVSGRLTKELGRIGGFSFYANNLLYHEPWKSTSRSNTLTQQNAGSFSFGVELYFNL